MQYTARKLKNLARSIIHQNAWYIAKQAYYRYFFSDICLINKSFKQTQGVLPNLIKPVTFNEKLQWLKLNWFDQTAVKCADKVDLRDYVKNKVGEQYLIPLIGVYSQVEEIDFDTLPESFALKAAHGSGMNIICRKKGELNISDAKASIRRWLQTNHFWLTREWVYLDMPPRIIAEDLLLEGGERLPADYKVFCFEGVPRFIQVDIGRFENHRRNIYDFNWTLLPFSIKHPSDPSYAPDKPPLEELRTVAAKLSTGFPHVRVDFYYVSGKLKVGEMTFFHGGGKEVFSPTEWDQRFGDYISLDHLTGERLPV